MHEIQKVDKPNTRPQHLKTGSYQTKSITRSNGLQAITNIGDVPNQFDGGSAGPKCGLLHFALQQKN